MSKKDKNKKAQKRQAQYEREKSRIESIRRMAHELRPALRAVGCDLAFYDYLDSYSAEFARTMEAAKSQFPTLVGVFEVDDDEFMSPTWEKYGVSDDAQIEFDLDEGFSGYGKNGDPTANLRGAATFFKDGENDFRTVILIPRSPKCSFVFPEMKYALKIGTLLHELGHVHDAERRGFLDPLARRFDLVEGEVYANCYALDRLAERHLNQTYSMIYDALAKTATAEGYVGQIGKGVIEKHPRRQISNWNDFMDAASEYVLKQKEQELNRRAIRPFL